MSDIDSSFEPTRPQAASFDEVWETLNTQLPVESTSRIMTGDLISVLASMHEAHPMEPFDPVATVQKMLPDRGPSIKISELQANYSTWYRSWPAELRAIVPAPQLSPDMVATIGDIATHLASCATNSEIAAIIGMHSSTLRYVLRHAGIVYEPARHEAANAGLPDLIKKSPYPNPADDPAIAEALAHPASTELQVAMCQYRERPRTMTITGIVSSYDRLTRRVEAAILRDPDAFANGYVVDVHNVADALKAAYDIEDLHTAEGALLMLAVRRVVTSRLHYNAALYPDEA